MKRRNKIWERAFQSKARASVVLLRWEHLGQEWEEGQCGCAGQSNREKGGDDSGEVSWGQLIEHFVSIVCRILCNSDGCLWRVLRWGIDMI